MDKPTYYWPNKESLQGKVIESFGACSGVTRTKYSEDKIQKTKYRRRFENRSIALDLG